MMARYEDPMTARKTEALESIAKGLELHGLLGALEAWRSGAIPLSCERRDAAAKRIGELLDGMTEAKR
jgi:hypothetical protein